MVLEDKSGERFTELWFLTDLWSQESKWVQGRVPISIEGPTEDFQYKVSINMDISQAKKSLWSWFKNGHSLIVKGKIAIMKNPLQMHQSSICKGFFHSR